MYIHISQYFFYTTTVMICRQISGWFWSMLCVEVGSWFVRESSIKGSLLFFIGFFYCVCFWLALIYKKKMFFFFYQHEVYYRNRTFAVRSFMVFNISFHWHSIRIQAFPVVAAATYTVPLYEVSNLNDKYIQLFYLTDTLYICQEVEKKVWFF